MGDGEERKEGGWMNGREQKNVVDNKSSIFRSFIQPCVFLHVGTGSVLFVHAFMSMRPCTPCWNRFGSVLFVHASMSLRPCPCEPCVHVRAVNQSKPSLTDWTTKVMSRRVNNKSLDQNPLVLLLIWVGHKIANISNLCSSK